MRFSGRRCTPGPDRSLPSNRCSAQRARQLVQQQGGYVKQREALIGSRELIEEELDGLRVAAKGYASINRVRQLERARPTSRARKPR